LLPCPPSDGVTDVDGDAAVADDCAAAVDDLSDAPVDDL